MPAKASWAKIMSRRRGQNAESTALAHLQKAGLKLIERNYACRRGEIDLIMQDRDNIALVEVRQRSHSQFGSAAESVTVHKQRRLIAAAGHWLVNHPEHANQALRFDVIGIDADGQLDWIRNAFQAES